MSYFQTYAIFKLNIKDIRVEKEQKQKGVVAVANLYTAIKFKCFFHQNTIPLICPQ